MWKIISGIFLGWTLGSNDSANIFGTGVAAKIIRYRTAIILIAIFVVLGAIMEGEMSFFGSSRIIMPNGRIIHQAKMGEEDWIVGELDQKEVERARLYYPNLKDRKVLEMVTFE